MHIINIQTEIAKLGLDLGGVMQYVTDQTLPLIQADGAAIELAESDEMVYRAASGIARGQLGLRLKIEKSLSGLCVISGNTMSCDDSETDSRVDRLACQKVGLRSMIVMPLKHNGISVGVLKAMSKQANKFQQQDLKLLQMLSEVVAAAMFFCVKYDNDNLFIRATHDSMTGLPNRALFMDRLRNAVTQSNRTKSLSGILIIDMDGLKALNDKHGHRIGDAAIIEFSNRLLNAARSSDTTARLGGDEFGVLLLQLEDKNGIDAAIQRINIEINLPFIFEGINYSLKASIGSALIPEDGLEPDKLLEIADQRMYKAKRAHKLMH